MKSIEICDTIKIDNDYLIELMKIRIVVIKQKKLKQDEIDDCKIKQKDEH
jgi:hypothetical protein